MSEIIKQEQGRSMVEMLGVLAVVGVLSVGGIAGYTYAMDKHKSNELLNEASKRAVVVAAQIASGMPVSLREFENDKTAGGTISADAVTDIDGAVGIKVTGVKDSVCENLIKLENDRVYMAKDDASLTALTETDCTGDNAEFLIVFEGMGGGTDSGTTITCEESEKVSVTYTGGHCCDETKTEKFCPGDEPATCVRDAGCDCSDEECCDGLGGSWAVDYYDDHSICCAEGIALCPDECGDCICVPEGYSSDCDYYACKVCSPSEGTALCSYDGGCICVPEGYSAECNYDGCKICSPSEGTAKCPGFGDCICSPEGYSSACNFDGCKVCSPTEGTAKCAENGGCICSPEGYSAECGGTECIACSDTNETAICPSQEGSCVCVKKGYDSACAYGACISCSPDEGKAMCGNGETGKTCRCVPSGSTMECNNTECKMCSESEGIAHCPGNRGSCICVPEGVNYACGYGGCIACSDAGKTAYCPTYGPCVCCRGTATCSWGSCSCD